MSSGAVAIDSMCRLKSSLHLRLVSRDGMLSPMTISTIQCGSEIIITVKLVRQCQCAVKIVRQYVIVC